MSTLADKRVLITGASGGLGRSMALEFARAGADLILNARNARRLETLRCEIERRGVECLTVVGDLTEPAVFDSLVRTGLEQQVEILVNNAGIVIIEPLDETSAERIDYNLRLNLAVPIQLTRAMLPMFKARGSGTVVNINSAGGKKPVLHHAVYCATKYALTGFAAALRMELRGQGVRVVSVSPGKMDTDLFRNAGLDWDTSEFIPPGDVARALVSLLQLSPKSCPSEIAIDRMQ